MSIQSIWQSFKRLMTTPIYTAEWHWSGDNLADLPKAAWRDFRRAIRGPIIRCLSCDDLIIVGEIYGSENGPPVVEVPHGKRFDLIGNIYIHDGPAVIVPRGVSPRKSTIRARQSGNWDDPATWEAQP